MVSSSVSAVDAPSKMSLKSTHLSPSPFSPLLDSLLTVLLLFLL